MKKNDIFTVTVAGFSASGDGVARIDGQVVFVKGALDGETCRVKILKVGKTQAYARVEQVLTPSAHRVEPLCPNFGKCGGCALMHMDYAQELAFKRDRVLDALRRIGGLEPEELTISASPREYAYRNKCIYSVSRDGKGRAVTGFFRQRSHDVIPVERCAIESDVSGRAAGAVRRWMDDCAVPAYDEATGTGIVRHVFCRYGFASGQAMVVLVSARDRIPEAPRLLALLRESCPEMTSLILNVNKAVGNTVLGGSFRTLWGADHIEDTLCGLTFKLSPRSFYQINHDQAQRLYAKALEYAGLTGRETVLDLYCGTGTITLCLARQAKIAIGAEIVPDAIRDAEENARRNGIANARFLCADAFAAAAQLDEEGIRPDVIVVDPPRKGLAPEVVEIIARMAPRRVVYVSCDSATLARDLKRFAPLGYALRAVEAFDMFPKTAHCEVVCQLTHNGEKGRDADLQEALSHDCH